MSYIRRRMAVASRETARVRSTSSRCLGYLLSELSLGALGQQVRVPPRPESEGALDWESDPHRHPSDAVSPVGDWELIL